MEFGALAELRDELLALPRRQIKQMATMMMAATNTADIARITGRVWAENKLEPGSDK